MLVNTCIGIAFWLTALFLLEWAKSFPETDWTKTNIDLPPFSVVLVVGLSTIVNLTMMASLSGCCFRMAP